MPDSRSVERIKELEEYITDPSSDQDEIYALNELAWELRMDDPEQVYTLCKRAEELSRTGEHSSEPYGPGIAASLVSQAFVDAYKGRLKSAVSKCLQALTLLNEQRSFTGVRVWFTLGWTHFFLSDYPKAMEYGLKALTLARELEDKLHEAWALDAIASFHGVTGDFEAAIPLHDEALILFRKLNEVLGEMRTLNNLAVSLHEMKQFERALKESSWSLEIAKKYNLNLDISNNSCTLADILVSMGKLDEAEAYLKESMTDNSSDLSLTQVFTLTRVGNLRLLKHDLAGAESYFSEALESAASLNQQAEQANCYKSLSEIYERQGQYSRALENYRIYHKLQDEVQGEQAAKRLDVLKITHQVETAQREAEIYRLKASELEKKVDEQKIVQKALEFQSTIDPLTNLYNRRYFDEVLEKEYSRHSRSGAELSLLIIDVDHFKEFNDTYGHVKGDDCLRRVAEVITSSISRPPDVAVRYGGDEFICLLPETNVIGANTVAEQILQGVMGLAIPHIFSKHQIVTLSIGIATVHCTKIGLAKDIIAKADEQLYIAKARGRNCNAAVYIE